MYIGGFSQYLTLTIKLLTSCPISVSCVRQSFLLTLWVLTAKWIGRLHNSMVFKVVLPLAYIIYFTDIFNCDGLMSANNVRRGFKLVRFFFGPGWKKVARLGSGWKFVGAFRSGVKQFASISGRVGSEWKFVGPVRSGVKKFALKSGRVGSG